MSKMKALLATGTLVVTAAVTVASSCEPKSTVTIFTDNGFVEVKTNKKTIEEILQDADIVVDSNTQRVYPNTDQEIVSDYITIKDAAIIKLTVDGEEREVFTWSKTVKDLLEEQEIELGGGDMVNVPLDQSIESGEDIRVIRVINKMITEKENIVASSRYYHDAKLQQGTQRVYRAPQDGKKEITYKVTYKDGVEVSKKKIDEKVISQPVQGIIHQNNRNHVSRSAAPDYGFVGTASYYGGKFHGRKTASGEIYNKNAYTAAHRTLPFGTIVEVTYLRTGKTVTVRINDRGPFIDGRIIDLSEAAASEIGLRPYGIGEVRVRVVGTTR